MKKAISLLSLLVSAFSFSFCQDDEDETFSRISVNYFRVVRCDYNGNSVSKDTFLLERGIKFTIIDEIIKDNKKYFIIKFWSWPKNNPYYEKLNVEGANVNKYFLVNASDFAKKTFKPYYSLTKIMRPSFSTGILILPVKLRLQNGTFSKDFSLGPAVGVKWRVNGKKPIFIHALFSAGITSVTLDSTSTKGAVTNSIERSALSLGFGTVVELPRSFQFGVFLGWDYLSSNTENWTYNKKPWLSLGLGYSILGKQGSSNGEGKN